MRFVFITIAKLHKYFYLKKNFYRYFYLNMPRFAVTLQCF